MSRRVTGRGQSQPTGVSNLYTTAKFFKSILDYQKFFDEHIISDNVIPQFASTYNDRLQNLQNDWFPQIFRGELIPNVGVHYPKNLDELMNRVDYPYMDDFNTIFNDRIKPFMNQLLFDSTALIEDKKLKYNDLGLGIFDFSKASMGLQPIYEYYSLKHKRYYEYNDVKIKKVKNKYKYFLKSDDTVLILVPKLKKGYDEKIIIKAFTEINNGSNVYETLKKYDLKIARFTSSVKKTYLNKEIANKPLNSVRLFVLIGANANVMQESYKYNGYTAIGLASLMTTLGYKVSIIGIKAANMEINRQGNFVNGARVIFTVLKDFNENLDTRRLLYLTSDMAYFRGKGFVDIIKISDFYNDALPYGLGRSVDENTIFDFVYNIFGAIDSKWNKDGSNKISSGMLYFDISNIYSEVAMREKFRTLILDVEQENKEAREQIRLRNV